MHGKFVPSVSQVMSCQNLSFPFDKFVEEDLLNRRSRIGTEVHRLADLHNQFGDLDLGWLTLDTHGFVESWIGLKRISGIKPYQWSTRRCELINGNPVTGETDVECLLNGHEAIIDLKTGSSKSDSWGCQLAAYECLKYRSPKIGRVIRAVAHLNSDGSPGKLVEFGECSPIDGTHYGDLFLAALHCTSYALRRGYLSEADFIDPR